MPGVPANDRKLGAEVRKMALKRIRLILLDTYDDKEFQKAVLLKLAPTLLPRLNEHDGGADKDGKPQPILFNLIKDVSSDNSDTEDNETLEEA